MEIGDYLEMSVLFESNDIKVCFFKNGQLIQLRSKSTSTYLKLDAKFGEIEDFCVEAIVGWDSKNNVNHRYAYSYGENATEILAPCVYPWNRNQMYEMKQEIYKKSRKYPFSFDMIDYNAFDSPVIKGKSQIEYCEPREFDFDRLIIKGVTLY